MSKLLIYSQEDLDLILELLKEKNNELEQRIAKAIEYVKNELYILGIRDNSKQQEELLNILKGEPNE